ncbi:hypothetical protein GPECTOR_25g412 [Gonium pectorale]|uniref:Ankyrin repeat domain-containing protein n=1 Tax=Gonium pectorale TaxID=33097 RepID=A0A150GG59_GONPE|nr:hypothetical protein GPECTOR_25g412 [Gonium pectorale]|eukprot:KXZ48827.1 hypothetical protein GPECTOR_25g412 [Gonium pectorale]
MAEPHAVGRAPPNIWLPGLVERFAGYLDPIFVACTLRLVDKATAEQFRGRSEYSSTVRLSQPVPPHAFAARWTPPGAMRDLKLEQRQQLLRLTAASGVVANLEVALAAVGFIPGRLQEMEVLKAGTVSGQADAVHFILARGYGDADAICMALHIAAGAGHQGVCEVLLADDRSPGVKLGHVATALEGGHPGLADWLLQRRREGPIGPTDSLEPRGWQGCIRLLSAAAEGCDLPVLQSLTGRFGGVPAGGVGYLLTVAAHSQAADWRAKVEWLELQAHPQSLHWDTHVCTMAAGCADAEDRLVWLLGRGYKIDKAAANGVLEAGNTAALELLLGRGLRPELRSVMAAAGAGQLEALMKLREYGCPVDAAEVARAAALGGQLPVLVWAVEELGASAQDLAVLNAVIGRCNLEALRWLRQRGCPLNGARVALLAVEGGNQMALAWAAEELGASVRSADLMDAAAASGCVEVMAWLREHGCPWGEGTFGGAAGAGCEAALEWLVEQGCPMPVSSAVM